MHKTIKLTVLTLLLFTVMMFSTTHLSAKNREQAAIKADYVLKAEGKSPQMVSVWKSNEYFAMSFNNQDVIGVWQNWNSNNPTFYQIYPQEAFRIEFSRMESQQQNGLLVQLKALMVQDQLAESIELKGSIPKELYLSAIEEGQDVINSLNRWSEFATYDYADIGDNEAIPELGRLIHQGFLPNF